MLDALTRSHVNVGRIAGIPVGLNASWFPVFGIVLWSLATGFLPHAAPTAGGAPLWAAAFAGTVLFFLSILAHEFGHALTARHAGIGVSSVTLFILGGVSRIAEEPRTAWEELRIAAAGPAVSFAVALLFLGGGLVTGGFPLVAAIAVYLVLVNFALAAFNLLPALPLDGGRVLRAFLWGLSGNASTATRWAAWSGRACGIAFIASGVVVALLGGLVPAAWLVGLGLFIERSAKGSVETIEVDIHIDVNRLRTDASGLPLLVEETMDEKRFRRLEARVIAWRARLDVLPRPAELEAQTDGPLVRRYQDDRMRMYELLDQVDRGIRAALSDEDVERAFHRLADLYRAWHPSVDRREPLPDAGEDATLAGRPDRFAPDPEEALRREPGSSIEI